MAFQTHLHDPPISGVECTVRSIGGCLLLHEYIHTSVKQCSAFPDPLWRHACCTANTVSASIVHIYNPPMLTVSRLDALSGSPHTNYSRSNSKTSIPNLTL